MKNLSATESAFVMGFLAGRKSPKYHTPRQISAKYPHFSVEMVDCYLNGEDDAIKNDSYRYDLIRKSQAVVSRKFKCNKFGLLENPVGAQVSMTCPMSF